MQGKDAPHPCLLDSELKHEKRHLSHWSSSVSLSHFHLGSPWRRERRDNSRGWASLPDLHPEVAMSPHGARGAQGPSDGCPVPVSAPSLVEKLPKFQSQGSSALQQGAVLACPAPGDPWCCARTAAPTALAVVLISVLAPSSELFQQEGNGWHSMKTFWISWSWCCWEAWVAQGDKRHWGLQSSLVRGSGLTSGSDRRVYPAWGRLEALQGPLCSQLFYLFVSHLPSFPWWTEMKVVCTPLQASSEIQLKYLILGAQGGLSHWTYSTGGLQPQGFFLVLFLGLWIFKTEIEHLNFYGW